LRPAKTGLLIFDLDGTLFETVTVSVPAIQSVLRDYGFPVPSHREITDTFGQPLTDFCAWLAHRSDPDLVPELADAIGGREMELISTEGKLYPGIPEALAELRARVSRMAVCSNGPEVYVIEVLRAHSLEGFFDEIRWRQSADTSKSQMLGDLLGRLDARPAAMIGDRAEDIRAARTNGIAAVGAAYGYSRPGDLDDADALAGAATDLPKLLSELLGLNGGAA